MRLGRYEFHVSSKRLFAWLMAVSAASAVLLPGDVTDGVDHLFSTLAAPFNRGGRVVSLAAVEKLRTGGLETVGGADYQKLLSAYQRNRAQLVNVEQELEQLQDFTSRLQGLRQQFGMARVRLIDARVVGTSTISWRRVNKVVLDQGSLQRIRKGQIALGFVGQENSKDAAAYNWCVVGKVLTSGVGSANLQLASDVDFGLGVFVEPGPGRAGDWRAQGTLQGDGADGMTCVVTGSEYPVQVGDAVVACSDPKTLSVATLVGYVQRCERDEKTPLMWRISVASAVDLNTIDRVVIVDSQ